jgi:hypothetical protein
MVKYLPHLSLAFASVLLSWGCASFQPGEIEEIGFLERAETQTRGDLRITVAIPSQPEARELFDSQLYQKKIQPLWVEVENRSSEVLVLLPYSADPDYFPPLEVAHLSHRTWAKKTNWKIDQFFYEQSFPKLVPAGETRSGFIFGNLDKGTKYVPLDVLFERHIESFEFFLDIPGFRADHVVVDWETLAEKAEQTTLETEDEVRAWFESLPCCATNKKGTKTGDPVNFGMVTSILAFRQGVLRTGWDQTAAKTIGSSLKTAGSALVGSRYRNAPFSPLYFFGRPHDLGLQKARSNIHQRNHLRLWLAPVNYQGKAIWVGQISRDIGSKLTTKSPTLTTHIIDPDVDDARDTLLIEMLSAHVLEAIGHTKGVGKRTLDSPGKNLTDDPFFTDGRRAVMFLSEEPVPYEDIRLLEWEPPDRDF